MTPVLILKQDSNVCGQRLLLARKSAFDRVATAAEKLPFVVEKSAKTARSRMYKHTVHKGIQTRLADPQSRTGESNILPGVVVSSKENRQQPNYMHCHNQRVERHDKDHCVSQIEKGSGK
jgi:hypothetical protein